MLIKIFDSRMTNLSIWILLIVSQTVLPKDVGGGIDHPLGSDFLALSTLPNISQIKDTLRLDNSHLNDWNPRFWMQNMDNKTLISNINLPGTCGNMTQRHLNLKNSAQYRFPPHHLSTKVMSIFSVINRLEISFLGE
jgi:hypothetical protein